MTDHVRDVDSEAQQWRSNVRHPILASKIAHLDPATLTNAYLTWWQAYTRSVQDAPSNRMGISSGDAAEAGEVANRAVRALLDENNETQDHEKEG